jgi:hypothetical protein
MQAIIAASQPAECVGSCASRCSIFGRERAMRWRRTERGGPPLADEDAPHAAEHAIADRSLSYR